MQILACYLQAQKHYKIGQHKQAIEKHLKELPIQFLSN